MSLKERIENARRLLREDRLANEAAVSSGVVLPLLDALGWPVFDPNVVAPEYRVEGRRVDFALLCHGRPSVFVEVKQPGLSNGADRQLFEYAFHTGVPIALLTDGSTWHFYLPAEQGSYHERRVYLLDLLERDVDECAERLQRYLEYGAVASGEAIERARHDYQRARQRREAKDALPRAWAQLLSQQDSDLVTLLMTEVESLSGYKPERADVLAYLRDLDASLDIPPPSPTRRPRKKSAAAQEPDKRHSQVGFEIRGNFTPCSKGTEVIAGVFEALGRYDRRFFEKFAALPKHGRTRRYLARDKEALYPGHPELQPQSVEVGDGWWLATHSSSAMKERMIAMACEVSGLTFGKDVKVTMP